MRYKQMLKIRKTEKDPQVRDRIFLNVLVKRDGMSVTGAALHLGMAPSWGVKWHNRYLKEGIAGLQTRTRSGRPPRISGETMKAIKKKVKKTVYLSNPRCASKRLSRHHLTPMCYGRLRPQMSCVGNASGSVQLQVGRPVF